MALTKRQKVGVGLGVGGLITAIIAAVKAKVVPPAEGDTKCVGFDLYTYHAGEWVLTETNSPTCGWTPGAAEFTVTDLVIEPATVYVGEPVKISVLVTNIGAKEGVKTVTLSGDVTAQKSTRLDPGTHWTVSFSYKPQEAGIYHVAVDGLFGTFEAIPLPEFLRCYLLDATTEMPLAGVSATANGYSLPPTSARGYTEIGVPLGTYTISFSKSGYYDYSETVEVRTGMPALRIYLTPIGVPPPEVTLDWMRVRPSVISLGETVYIDCQCICNVPGTYPVDCVIDGVVLTQDYTFTPAQVWSARTFEYTPTAPRTYTATILGVSKTFDVREVVTGIFYNPITGAFFDNEIDLIKSLAPEWSFEEDGYVTYRWKCPYCGLRFTEEGAEIDAPSILLHGSTRLFEHIETEHELRCPLCGIDLTWGNSAAMRATTWARHLEEVHGKPAPTVEVTPLYQCWYRHWPKYSTAYHNTYWDAGAGAAQYGPDSIDKSSFWINYFGATMTIATPSPGYWFIHEDYGPEDYDLRAEELKFRVPVLAGKSWRLRFGTWRHGEDVSIGPHRVWTCEPVIEGFGEIVKIDKGIIETGYGYSLTAAFEYDGEILVIPNLYMRPNPIGWGIVRWRKNPEFDDLWADP